MSPTDIRRISVLFYNPGAGHKFRREAWPLGTFIYSQKAYPQGIPINPNTSQAMGLPEGTVVRFQPYLQMYSSQSGACEMYALTNEDLFAQDWEEAHP